MCIRDSNDRIIRYLTENRGIEKNLVEEWISSGDVYEEKKHLSLIHILLVGFAIGVGIGSALDGQNRNRESDESQKDDEEE